MEYRVDPYISWVMFIQCDLWAHVESIVIKNITFVVSENKMSNKEIKIYCF